MASAAAPAAREPEPAIMYTIGNTATIMTELLAMVAAIDHNGQRCGHRT